MNANETNPHILSVSQLTNAIKLCLEQTFPVVWVQGEISNFKSQNTGHLYFSINDSNAQLSAVMFRKDAATLRQLPKNGDKVIITGEINVYPASGKYQIIVKEMRLVGIGELLIKLEELKQKILKKGWFKKEHKKNIPKFPKRIGVVTSPTGAVIQDIINVLTRRYSGFHLILNPVRVQGSEAAREIAQAIRQFNEQKLVDVIIIGRGGGSIEDLWPFNEEIVAEAIFYSEIPIIAAVGHETDHCIAEYVADVRAPTPSAAAELVTAERAQQIKYLDQLCERLQQTMKLIIKGHQEKLKSTLKQPLFTSPYYLIGPWIQKFDDLKQDLDQSISLKLQNLKILLNSKRQHVEALKPTAQIINFRQKLNYWNQSIHRAMIQKLTMVRRNLKNHEVILDKSWNAKIELCYKTFDAEQKLRQLQWLWRNNLDKKRDRLQNVKTTLVAIDPKILLTKGYSILFSQKTGSIIKSIHQLHKTEDIRLLLSDGEALSTIKEVIKK